MDTLYLDIVQSYQKRAAIEHKLFALSMEMLASPDCWNPHAERITARYHQALADKHAQRARDLMAKEVLNIPFEQRRIRNWFERLPST